VSGYRRSFPTRWNDNDVYGHVNNAVYYEAMDTTINTWLIAEGGLANDTIGVCASSNCRYTASGSFPDSLAVDLSVARLGATSITWRLRIAREHDDLELATGEFVHVFVGRESRRPVPIPDGLRSAVEAQLEVAA
jgi:acyl-CoA thioester hydrolase